MFIYFNGEIYLEFPFSEFENLTTFFILMLKKIKSLILCVLVNFGIKGSKKCLFVSY